MRILLVYDTSPDHPEFFRWSTLVRALSRDHEIRTAWWLLPQKPSSRPELAAGVLTTAEFEAFNPELILFDGPPDPRTPTDRARRIPWNLEEDHLRRGGAVVFVRIGPNDLGESTAFAEYGFPLATSKFGKPAWVQDQSGQAVVIDSVRLPPPLSLVRREPLERLEINMPAVLRDTTGCLLWAPDGYDAKDPGWLYEGDLDVKKPYIIAAWNSRPGPVFLFTGDMFSDSMIGRAQNSLFLDIVMQAIPELQRRSALVRADNSFGRSHRVDADAADAVRDTGDASHGTQPAAEQTTGTNAAAVSERQPPKLERVADFGIVTALRDEMLAVLRTLGPVREIHGQQQDIRYYYVATVRCEDGSDQTVACVLANEMGQQPALNATRDLIAAWKPRHLLLVGIAGGIAARGVGCGDVIVPRRVHYYEPGKLTPKGRRQRGPSFDASARLQAAVEALAIQKRSSWPSRIRNKRPAGGARRAPLIHRDELASGEDVWAHLGAATVREVMSRFDKVIAVENEAAGVFNAVHEAVHMPDVLVIKAASDLVDGKDDRWRDFARHAAAAFAVALIEKVGSRWQLDGPAATALREFESKRTLAQERFRAQEFERATILAEECIPLAQVAGRPELEAEMRLQAARAWAEQLNATRGGWQPRTREEPIGRIEEHLRIAADLGASEIDVAHGRARASLLQGDGESALGAARMAFGAAGHGTSDWADALILMLQAFWQLGSFDEALQLADDISAGLATFASGEDRLVRAATWLNTLVRAGRIPDDEPGSFCAIARKAVASAQVSPSRAAHIVGWVAALLDDPNTGAQKLALREVAYEFAEQGVQLSAAPPR